MALRIAFKGTPDYVVPAVQALNKSAHDLVCIYTQPPRPKGRKQQLVETPVHQFVNEQNIEVRHPLNFKSEEDVKAFEALDLDIAVVAAYGLLLPESILKAPKYGCINVHPSLLPCWRGPSPIQYAIWKGDEETGVSIMSLDKGMDSGPIFAQEKTHIGNKNFIQLNEELWQTGTKLLLNVIDQISETGEVKTTPQNEEDVTYCKLFTKEQGHIDWNRSAVEIDRQVRALNPWPGTYSFINDKRLKILDVSLTDQKTDKPAGQILDSGCVACDKGSVLKLEQIQPENKKPMDIKTALNGGHIKIGDILS